jgi:hypothetical protein
MWHELIFMDSSVLKHRQGCRRTYHAYTYGRSLHLIWEAIGAGQHRVHATERWAESHCLWHRVRHSNLISNVERIRSSWVQYSYHNIISNGSRKSILSAQNSTERDFRSGWLGGSIGTCREVGLHPQPIWWQSQFKIGSNSSSKLGKTLVENWLPNFAQCIYRNLIKGVANISSAMAQCRGDWCRTSL